MKKTLIIVIIFLLLILMGYILIQSLHIGNFAVLGIKDLDEQNKELDNTIETASRLTGTEYQRTIMELTNSSKQYDTAKKEYDQLVSISAANRLEKYKIEYLWTRIGSHATSNDVSLTLKVNANSASEATGFYDLEFTAAGSYVSVIDFIYDVENDSALGFKISDFKMQGSDGGVTGTFTCKNISIDLEADLIANSAQDSNENQTSNNTGNTTNTANTNANTNTVNTNNAANLNKTNTNINGQ